MARFHDGEVAVQERLGVREDATRVGTMIQPLIAPALTRFLAGQRIAVAASLDPEGRPWASLLTGPPGFLQVVGQRELHVATHPSADPLLTRNLGARPEIGLLAIDLATRRRARLNGRGRIEDGALSLVTDEVYGNCPKYIQKRRVVGEAETAQGASIRSDRLDAQAARLLQRADTLFLATWHPGGGADASHRGGRAGFVRVEDDRTLELPDYPGNNMYNSLGNLATHPWAGILVVDFENGDVVQLTGRTEIVWKPVTAVRIRVEEVVRRPGACPLRFELVEPSPVNPPLVTLPDAPASEE